MAKTSYYSIPYSVNMDRGYGVEGISDTLHLEFDETGELIDAQLEGLHFVTEYEFCIDYNITTEIAKKLISEV